jgi:hypothetical protein
MIINGERGLKLQSGSRSPGQQCVVQKHRIDKVESWVVIGSGKVTQSTVG